MAKIAHSCTAPQSSSKKFTNGKQISHSANVDGVNLPLSWATSVPILVFLGLSVLELRLMYATDRPQTDLGCPVSWEGTLRSGGHKSHMGAEPRWWLLQSQLAGEK